MNDFSILQQALRFSGSIQTEDLGCISNISRRDFDERESFLFRAKAPCLEYACLMIENALLLHTNRAGRIYVGFEKLSYMRPVINRYLRIADVSQSVNVFGEADWKPPRHPNMRVIKLSPHSKIAREWFVIADSPSLRVALVSFDQDGFEVPALESRHFTAFKSSNADLVASLASVAEGLIDESLAA